MQSSSPDPVEIIGRIEAVPSILDTVHRITGMRFAAVARVTSREWLACAVKDDIDFGLKVGGNLQLDTTICEEIRQSHHAVVISDVQGDALYRDHHTPRIYGFRSYVSYPIFLSDGSMWGTLCAIDPQPRDLDRPEVRNTFKMFADLIGFHLNMAGLLDAEQAQSLQREEFIAVLGHDLRNPLASVKAGVTMLRRQPDEARAALVLNRMDSSIDRMARLVDDILDFARGRLGSGIPLRFTESDVGAIVQHAVDELAAHHPDRSIVIEQAARAPVSCDPQRIAQLISNLVGNALTHGGRDQPIRVGSLTDGDVLEVYVANSGNPISPAALSSIFQPYARGGQSAAGEGLGLGLYIASTIAKAHSGELSATSSDTETCFTFRMPIAAYQG